MDAALGSCWRAERDANDRDVAYQQGFADGFDVGRHTTPALDGELLTTLIRLAHPDAHPPERFALANATTVRLLELRRLVAA